jgi:hypothetical protein
MADIGKRVSVYIKLENLAKWQELDNKSQWVNDCLTGTEDSFERSVKRIIKQSIPEIVEALRGY